MANEEIVTTLEEINKQIAEKPNLPEVEPEGLQVGFPPEPKEAPRKAAKEKIEIEVVDDTPPEDRGRKPMKTPPKDSDEIDEVQEKVQKRMDELKRAYHEERRAKEQAAREQAEALAYAKALIDENKKLQKRLSAGEQVLAKEVQSKGELALKSAKKSLQEAQEAGDSEKVADAMSEITRVTMEQENWKRFQPSRVSDDPPPTLQPQNNPVAYPQTTQQAVPPDEKAMAWYNKNTWFGVDEERTSFAYGLHQKLVNEGIDPRSDKYYERIEARLRQVFPEKYESEASGNSDEQEEDSQQKRVEKRQQTTVVAPATRTTSSKKIVLTKSQVAIARRLGVPLEVYAKHVAMQESR
jgi:hypothetical protein